MSFCLIIYTPINYKTIRQNKVCIYSVQGGHVVIQLLFRFRRHRGGIQRYFLKRVFFCPKHIYCPQIYICSEYLCWYVTYAACGLELVHVSIPLFGGRDFVDNNLCVCRSASQSYGSSKPLPPVVYIPLLVCSYVYVCKPR